MNRFPPHNLGGGLHSHGECEIQCRDESCNQGYIRVPTQGAPIRLENVTDGLRIYIASPGGFKTFIDQMSKAAAGDPVDMSKVPEIFRNHRIEMKQ